MAMNDLLMIFSATITPHFFNDFIKSLLLGMDAEKRTHERKLQNNGLSGGRG